MVDVIQFPPRPNMAQYRTPVISGVKSADVGFTTFQLSNWLAGHPDETLTDKDLAEANAHNADMWRLEATKFASELAKTRHELFDAKAAAVRYAVRNRELEKRDVSLAEALMTIVNLFRGGRK
jgi:hypothetical protein